jgi:hypothetical protein
MPEDEMGRRLVDEERLEEETCLIALLAQL